MSLYSKSVTAIGTATLCTLLAACGSDSTSPSQSTVTQAQINTDVAYSTGADVSSDIADYTATETTVGSAARVGRMPLGASVKVVPSQTVCLDTTVAYSLIWNADTLTAHRTAVAFSLGACNAETVDSVAFTGVDSLAVNDTHWTRHAVRQRQFAVIGAPSLDSATSHVWNGVANGHDSSTWQGSVNTRVYGGTGYDTTTALTFPHPRTGPYPASGTFSRWANWTLNITGAKTETVSVARHFVVTFNGTEDVPVVIYDAQTGTQVLVCTVDLGTHRLVPNSCDNPR